MKLVIWGVSEGERENEKEEAGSRFSIWIMLLVFFFPSVIWLWPFQKKISFLSVAHSHLFRLDKKNGQNIFIFNTYIVCICIFTHLQSKSWNIDTKSEIDKTRFILRFYESHAWNYLPQIMRASDDSFAVLRLTQKEHSYELFWAFNHLDLFLCL